MSLRVVSLEAQNVLRLSAVEIKWDADQSVLTVGGANGAGKSSALNCVAMALGGAALCPAEPLKRGELKGHVSLDLGDLRIRREFSREKLPCSCGVVADNGATVIEDHKETCALRTGALSETKSRLVVKNADDITQGTPQAILDKLVGRMTFDPMAFVNEEPARQEEILRKIVNIDVSKFEIDRKTAYERRTVFNRQHKDALVQIEAMPHFDDAPTEELSMDEVSDIMRRHDELRAAATVAATNFASCRKEHDNWMRAEQTWKDKVEQLENELAGARAALSNLQAEGVGIKTALDNAQKAEVAANVALPDSSEVRERIAQIEATNTRVRANRAYLKAVDAATEIAKKIGDETLTIQTAENAKRDALRAVVFPVAGLGLSDDVGVTFNDIPFKQASTAQQLRVSTAIGFALHPKLKLLLVRNGNALDDDSLKIIADEARAAGGQILMEYVTKNASDVSVFIEDGHNA